MKFLNNFNDQLQHLSFKECPFANIPLHITTNGCCIGVDTNTQYHIFKKIPYTLNMQNNPITKLFENSSIIYDIAPYCREPNYIRLITPLSSEYEYITSLFTTNNSVLLFLQRHLYQYFVDILPRLNDYTIPFISPNVFINNAIQNNNTANNPLENLTITNTTTNRIQWQTQTDNTGDLTPFMNYIYSLELEKFNHLHPLCIFDTAILNFNEKLLFFMKPTQITFMFPDFLKYFRAIFFEIIYEYAKSKDCKTSFQNNPRKLKVKTLCHAGFFITKRHTPPEFKCVASSIEACPHINDNLLPNGKVPLLSTDTLCHYLIQKYIQDYPDDNQINSILGFRCKFQDLNLDDDKQHAKEKIFAFYNIFSKTNNIHRMCIPDKYLTVDWFKWVISLFHM